MKKTNFIFLFILCTLLTLNSCTSRQSINYSDFPVNYSKKSKNKNSEWPDKKLRKTFKSYWSEIYEGNLNEAYQIEAPHVQIMLGKQKFTNYTKYAQVNEIKKVEIQRIKKNGPYSYDIFAKFELKGKNTDNNQFYLTDRWVILSNNWYHVIQNKSLFPFLN